jgi:hypothetical protein
MRQIVYRILAGVIVIAAGYTAFLTFSDGDFTTGFPFGIVSAILGFLVIVPTFTAYALYGEKAGNRVLVPLVKLLNLPEALLNRLAHRYVALPKEFNQSGHGVDTLANPNSVVESTDPNLKSTSEHSNNA